MTDPLNWLRSDLEGARERLEAASDDDRTEVERQVFAAGIVDHDLPAALAVLDRVGEALDVLDESEWERLYEAVAWEDPEGADLLDALAAEAHHREDPS